MTPYSRQNFGCCLSACDSPLRRSYRTEASACQLSPCLSLSLSFFFGLATQQLRTLVRLLIVAATIGPPTESRPHLIHLIGMTTATFFFLPYLFHIRNDVGAYRAHGMLFIRHPVSVTLHSSIPHLLWKPAAEQRPVHIRHLSLYNFLRFSCGSTPDQTHSSHCRRFGCTGCRRPVNL